MLCSSSLCTGCGACMNICPNHAIEMVKNDFGFLYPSIELCKCKHCGLCEKVCPEIYSVKRSNIKTVYAGYALDDTIHNTSTSGGVATILARYVLLKNGIVYGHAYDDSLFLKCTEIKKTKELSKIQGSKYVQSDIGYTYAAIKKLLLANKTVLFVGAPCQVGGLLSFVGKDCDNLITVSFVCGGFPSQQYLHDYLMERFANETFSSIQFRNGTKYILNLFKNGLLYKTIDRWKSEYMIAYDERVSLRECCYNCQYANTNRIGDFTIGDFWGLKETKFSEEEKGKGISLIIASTLKAQEILKSCVDKKLLAIEEHSITEATPNNPRLSYPVIKTDNVEQFKSEYLRTGFTKAIRKLYGKKYLGYRLKAKLKKIKILNQLYHWVKNEAKRTTI